MALSGDQKLIFAEMVLDKKDILFGKYSPKLTKAVKSRCWEDIFDLLVSHGVNVSSVHHLRKVIWDNMKRATQKKLMSSGDGEQQQQQQPLSQLDVVVADILGKKCDISRMARPRPEKKPSLKALNNGIQVDGREIKDLDKRKMQLSLLEQEAHIKYLEAQTRLADAKTALIKAQLQELERKQEFGSL